MNTSKILMIIILMINLTNAQDYVFFNDSPNNNYYEASFGFENEPSTLERYNGNKFPVSTDFFYSGLNSLKLTWISKDTGNWGMAVAAPGWPGHDVTVKDSITFYVYSETVINDTSLPKIYIEDLSNTQTPKINLSDYSSDIDSQVWTKLSVPLQLFKKNPGSTDLTQIKTIFFGQSISDSIEHTLYIDEVRMITDSENDTTLPSTPSNVIAKGYDHHIDVMWDLNTDQETNGYYIYRLEDSVYLRIGQAPSDIRFFTDWIGTHDITHSYKITAFDAGSVESEMSAEVTALTYQMSDEELLTMLQEATFRYFWDYAHPVSGLARERLGSGNTVTSGGSGFGIMAILVGVERGFISRDGGVERLLKILNFLNDNADRFHGAFSHWLNGATGAVIPFSPNDNGGDLVETSFMIQGLLTARQYFNLENEDENQIRNIITSIWETVEWSWYKRFPNNPWLYWHWSPNYGWVKNHFLWGYNEVMITYLLAIASPTYSVSHNLYYTGWAHINYPPSYENGNSFYGIPLFVGSDYGGPLFFAHYSYLGFDPRNKREKYANYFDQNRNHALINRAYCIDNPNGFQGYNENTWGLTACDGPFGYNAFSPTNDNGTIAPTAALSSFPYTPEESMAAFKNLYTNYGENLWDVFGFKDAFNLTQNWFADSYIAIDQGPIIVMVENYRSGLLWENFMANPEIQPMLDSIGFVSDSTTDVNEENIIADEFRLIGNYPNPFNPSTTIMFSLPSIENVRLSIYNSLGENVTEISGEFEKGVNKIYWNGTDNFHNTVSSGIYFYRLTAGKKTLTGKMILQK